MAKELRRQARRSNDRRDSERRADMFGPVMNDVSKAQLSDTLTPKNARVEIRCDAETKAAMEAIAGRFGLTVTDYLLRLHGLAVVRLENYPLERE